MDESEIEQWHDEDVAIRRSAAAAFDRAVDDNTPLDTNKRLDIIIGLLLKIIDEGIPHQ